MSDEDDDNVVQFKGMTRLDIPVPRVIENVPREDLESAIVIGSDKNDELFFASSIGSAPEIMWLLELAKSELLERTNQIDEE